MADLSGFTAFLRNYAQIPTSALPDGSPYIDDAFNAASDVVNPDINTVSPRQYDMAFYNFGTDYILNWTPDQPGQTYFTTIRNKDNLNLTGFVAGVIQSAGDEGTNESLLVPDFMKNLMLSDLQNLKTPYGRAYLAIAQKYGPNIWGVS